MSDFVIFTDNTCDLPLELCEQYDLQRVFLDVNFASGQQLKNIDDVDEFYSILSLKNLAKTSAVNPQQFIDAFSPILSSGQDILYFGLASSLSATFQHSLIAQKDLTALYPERSIVCLNSRCVAPGLGLLAMQAGAKRLQGESMDSVIDYIQNEKHRITHDFTVEKLDYLHAGGRISHAVKILGSALDINPVMIFNDEDKLAKVGQKIHRKPTLRSIIKKIDSNMVDPNGTLIIAHGNCQSDVDYCVELIRACPRIKNAKLIFTRIGAVIGTHVGPTVIAFFYEGYHR